MPGIEALVAVRIPVRDPMEGPVIGLERQIMVDGTRPPPGCAVPRSVRASRSATASNGCQPPFCAGVLPYPAAVTRRVLVLNAGSSTLKASVVEVDPADPYRPSPPIDATTVSWGSDASRTTGRNDHLRRVLDRFASAGIDPASPRGRGSSRRPRRRPVHRPPRSSTPACWTSSMRSRRSRRSTTRSRWTRSVPPGCCCHRSPTSRRSTRRSTPRCRTSARTYPVPQALARGTRDPPVRLPRPIGRVGHAPRRRRC